MGMVVWRGSCVEGRKVMRKGRRWRRERRLGVVVDELLGCGGWVLDRQWRGGLGEDREGEGQNLKLPRK